MVSRLSTPSAPSTPASRKAPATPRAGSSHGSVYAASWKTTSTRHIAQQVVQPLIKQTSSLIHAYMVCGLNRDPTEWVVAPKAMMGKPQRMSGSVGSFLSPQLLGSIPSHDRDEQTVQMFAAALKAVFPSDCEICIGTKPPGSTCHNFVLQMDPNRSLYGAALRLWVRSDAQRLPKIAAVLDTSELDNLPSSVSVWIPYCLAFFSHYPLFDLMSDYLRCSWMLWSKEPDNFNKHGVQRLMRMPAPKPGQLLRIALDKYTLCYQIPSLSTDFQNFALWPIFTCLSAEHIVAVLEAATSPSGQIIFTSNHTSALTVVAEGLRFYLGSWAGLYVPVVYGRHAQELIDEPAPYILGIPKQSRPLFNPPRDALVIDLDCNRIFTSMPPRSLSPRQRTKYSSLLSQAVGQVKIEGVPIHLQSAYEQNVRFSAFGPTLAENTTLSVKEPDWWDHGRVLSAMQYVCVRVRRNFKFLSLWKNFSKQPKRLGAQDLANMLHHRNHLARSLDEAWREYIGMKRRSDIRAVTHQKTVASLTEELDKSKKDFTELSECTEQLIEETRHLQSVINQRNRDILRISEQLSDKTIHAKQMSNHVAELQSDLNAATKTLKMQEELLDEMKSQSKGRVSQERDDAQRAVIHLTSLISGQVAYIERVMASLISSGRPSSQQRLGEDANKRRSFQRSPSPQVSPRTPTTPAIPLQSKSSRRNTVDFSQMNGLDRSNRRLSHMVQDTESFDEKVRVIAETVRKINNQCFAAIEDLAAKRENKHQRANEASDSDGGERITSPRSILTVSTPDLDSRAATALSGSVVDFGTGDGEEGTPSVRIQAIVEEMESDIEREHFVDAPSVLGSAVEKKSPLRTFIETERVKLGA